MHRQSRRGIALFLTLGFTSILLMLLAATLTSTNGGNILSQDYHGRTAARYVAESGLAMVQKELSNDPNWDTGFNGVDTPFGTGKVWVRFGPSVNNLTGSSILSGPYGSDIPPGTAYIRVEGRAHGQSEVIECLLGRQRDELTNSAIVATRKIFFREHLDISGRKSSDDAQPVEADVVSNSDSDSAGTIDWLNPGGANRMQGTVRSASPNNGAISSDLVALATHSRTDQSPVPVENVNIRSAVEAKSGVPAGIPNIPTSPLTGDCYEGSDTTVAGDLELNNASLYIDGDFTVVGSIRGRGAIFVTGNTTFSGDAEVFANEDGVVVYSQGNVHLKGFDGTLWMDEQVPA